jgi:hypothetical protein
MASLLAVDPGLRTGLALYGPDARRVWYRSQHYATRTSHRGASTACSTAYHPGAGCFITALPGGGFRLTGLVEGSRSSGGAVRTP